jgi:hypothetical protein
VTEELSPETVRGWIDQDLVNRVEQYPDEMAEFNFTVEISNLLLHVIRRKPDGPILIGQEIEYDDEIRSQIRALSESSRNELVARIRETLTASPVVYGFHDKQGSNVRFQEMQRIFVEYRIYPDTLSQHTLMNGLIDVWKVLRYVDDIVTLIDAVEE